LNWLREFEAGSRLYALSGRLGFDYKSLYLFSNYFGSNKYQTLVLKAGRAYRTGRTYLSLKAYRPQTTFVVPKL